MNIISLLIVDDQPLYRLGVESCIPFLNFEIEVHHANNGLEAIDVFRKNKIDLIFMDLQMPKMNGVEATLKIREIDSKVKIIGLSMFDDMFNVTQMLSAGVNGYSLKSVGIQDVKNIFDCAIKGDFYITKEIVGYLDHYQEFKNGSNHNGELPKLSEREIEVLILICNQLSSKEIASKLGISENTIENHRAHIMKKTLSKNIVGLILYAISNKFITAY